jgi:hypothetical protein
MPDGEIAGYFWATATDLGRVHRPAGSSSAHRAVRELYSSMQDAHRRGLTPADVLTLFSREPGVGPVTEAPDLAAIEEMACVVTSADDQRMLDQLVPVDNPAWQELAEAYDALTDEDRDIPWGGGQRSPSGAIQMSYPLYGKPLKRVVDALRSVGAVTMEYGWMGNPLPEVPPSGRMAPADAVRAATAIVLGERCCDGMIDDAVKDGTLDAVVAALRAWHAGARTTRDDDKNGAAAAPRCRVDEN